MSKNHTLEITTPSSSLDYVPSSNKRRVIAVRRRMNPWHWFGWLRKTLKSRPNREFYSQAEKRQHQHVKMAQRAANHHHGFKF
jgi:hypothetical protein